MRKLILIILALALTAGLLSGCGAAPVQSDAGKLSIVTTIFPEYDWVREIMGDRAGDAEITMLLENGSDLHSYQPSADDVIRISTCDLFIYVGGESDGWVKEALKEAVNQNMAVINLLEALGGAVKEEELAEGMEGEEEAEPGYDEHVWLSLKNARILCGVIAEALSAIDPENGAVYQRNASAYQERLSALDREYAQAAEAARLNTLLFGDRFPFRYLADDYGVNYYAAFAGCSAETEASFETIAFLAGKLNELGLHTVLTLEGTDGRIARTVIDAAGAGDRQILAMNSLQSVTSEDIENGVTYLSVMEDNLAVLKDALK